MATTGWTTATTRRETRVHDVLLVDDHELIRQGLRRAFERVRRTSRSWARQARSPRRVEAVAKLEPQVVILDVRLPDGSGLEAATKMRELHNDIGIVVLTMYAGDEQLFGALEAGASAFVPKDAPRTTWSPRPGTRPSHRGRSRPTTWRAPCADGSARAVRS